MKSHIPLLAVAFPALLSAAITSAPRGAMTPDSSSLSVATDRGTLRITPITDDIFRITVIPDSIGSERYLPSKSVILTPQNHRVNVAAAPNLISMKSPSTSIVIDRNTGLVSFRDSTGRVLLDEAAGLDNRGRTKTITFTTPDRQKFFGAGERGHSLELSGDSLPMYNRQNYGYTGSDPRIRQMNITMPYFVSDHGYGILVDDHNKAMLTLGDTITYSSEKPASLISYYFINGKGSMAGTAENFTRLTGRQELPPLWALGYITSKYGYHNEKETLGAIDSLKTRGYPVDGIVLDLYWYGKETDMGRLEWNKQQFPDHAKMLQTLRDRGVKTVIISQPYINKIGAIDNYNMLDSLGMLTHNAQGRTNDVTTWVGEAGMFDVANPDTREWLWNRYRDLTEDGVEGWWGDLGEPEVHPETIVHANGQTAEQYHNVYGNEWSRIIYDGFKQDFPDRRLVTLMRGGTAGLQRYNVFPWSTDVSRSWGGFEPQVKIMLNSGLSGLGYMSSDIGGFAVDNKAPKDPELYVRWLEMGTFTPMLRTHAQYQPEPYHYPKQEKITLKFIKERYRWLPYNYTLAWQNASMGLPLARPLDFDSRDGAKYASVEDEYLWGDEVLVAPVLKKGARSRKVTFPDGQWIDWNNPARRYRGGTTATVAAPLDVLPMFVRAGSFIPLYTQPIENTTQYDPSKLTVNYYPAKEWSNYTLFDDDRVSTRSLQDGAYRLLHFSGSKQGAETYIEVTSSGNGYKGMSPAVELTFNVIGVERAPKSVTVDGEQLNAADWSYSAAQRTLTIRTTFTTGKKLSIAAK